MLKKDTKLISLKKWYCGCERDFYYSSGLSRHIKNKHSGLAPKGTVKLKMGRPKINRKCCGIKFNSR